MPLQDANPTPSFGGFGLRRFYLSDALKQVPWGSCGAIINRGLTAYVDLLERCPSRMARTVSPRLDWVNGPPVHQMT